MAATFTLITSPRPGSGLAHRNPDNTVTLYGSVNCGTHAVGGVSLTPAIVNAGISDTTLQIASILLVKVLGRSVDLKSSAKWVRSSAKLQWAFEDQTSGVHADAGTADLSNANNDVDVEIIATVA
mgnify:CR=1 FL=1